MNNELLNIILTDKPEFVFQIFPYLDTNNIHYIQQNATKYAINNMIYPITQNNIDILTTLNLKFIEHSIQQKEFNKIYLEKQNDVFNSTTLLNVEEDLDINLYPGILSYIDNVIQARHSINFKHNLGLLPEYMNTLTKNTSFIHYIFKNKELTLSVEDPMSLLKSNLAYFQYSNQLKWRMNQIGSIHQIDFLLKNDPYLNDNFKQYYKALTNSRPLRLYYLNQIQSHLDIKDIIIELNLYRLSKLKKLKHIFNSEIIDHIKRLHEIRNVLGDDIKSFIIDGIRNYKKDIKIIDVQFDN